MRQITKSVMIDVSEKPRIARRSVALGRIRLSPRTISKLSSGMVQKGDPFSVAEVAAIMAAKNTSRLIPLCHSIPLTGVHLRSTIERDGLSVKAEVKTTEKTGVEMEALTAVTVYLLTIWDMTKQYEKNEAGQYPDTMIENVKVIVKEKSHDRRKINART